MLEDHRIALPSLPVHRPHVSSRSRPDCTIRQAGPDCTCRHGACGAQPDSGAIMLMAAHGGLWPSWWNFTVTDIALHEYHGLLRYRIYNAMGWNTTITKPGAS